MYYLNRLVQTPIFMHTTHNRLPKRAARRAKAAPPNAGVRSTTGKSLCPTVSSPLSPRALGIRVAFAKTAPPNAGAAIQARRSTRPRACSPPLRRRPAFLWHTPRQHRQMLGQQPFRTSRRTRRQIHSYLRKHSAFLWHTPRRYC